MNTRTAAPVAITVSLVVLLSGCAGATGQGGQVRDDLGPAANAAQQGLVHGHVVGADRIERAMQAAAARSVNTDLARARSAENRRQMHANLQVDVTVPFSAEVRRELHAGQPVGTTVEVGDDLSPLGGAD
ncbi:hypothetical protein [Agromyces sp. Marseille-P2726]|uniref:hypothetical protein n=1 Tax=Agromyces sp. Marseille-P2726 TaxID=2709132 RepID=UPI00156E1C2B|nr:hypothetical protein [Agromyces sp. Marseille-P2726]